MSFLGSYPHPLFKDEFHLIEVRDLLRGITVDDDQIGLLAWLDRANLSVLAQVDRAVHGDDAQRFDGRKSTLLHQQFEFTLMGKPRNDTRLASIGSRHQETAQANEFMSDFGLLIDKSCRVRLHCTAG